MSHSSTFTEIIRLARGLTPLEKLQLIEQIAPDLEAALKPDAGISSFDAFEKLMAEGDTDAVAVGHMDDSRQSVYSRVKDE